MQNNILAAADRAADYVRSRTSLRPRIGFVLGSGLSPLADQVQDATVIPFGEIPGFPQSTVPGHAGRLLLGSLADRPVAMMQGRVHSYEGYSAAEITLPIRMMQRLGIQTLVVTNAAGGIAPQLKTGDLMAITDHINFLGLAGQHPLRGPNDGRLGVRFPEMSRAYDPHLLELARDVARQQGATLREGVYCTVSGPSFETPAEIRMLRTLGADAVGMSTAPEVVVARHGGMRVLGISLISNETIDSIDASPESQPNHEEVLEAGRKAVPILTALLVGILRRINLD